MNYIKKHMLDEDESAYEGVISKWIVMPSIVYCFLALLLASFLTALWWVAAALMIVFGVAVLIQSVVYVLTTEVTVTNSRVLMKKGLISIETDDLSLHRVEQIEVRQSLLGRVLNFGTVVIQGVGIGAITIRGVKSPYKLRKYVNSAHNEGS